MIDAAMDDDYDAFDAMLNRGAYLRKLRELADRDEAERAAHEESQDEDEEEPDGDTLYYESDYLSRQRYHDDYKHVNYRFIDFGASAVGNINNKENGPTVLEPEVSFPLIIEQDRAMGKGGLVWDAGFILAEHVIHQRSEWLHSSGQVHDNDNPPKPMRLVELGAGTGITGLMVAAALPDVHVAITDLPELMPLLKRNLAHNVATTANATAFPLAWGTNVLGNYDLILGADVVAGIYDPHKLAQTIADLCHENTLVYLATNSRLHEILATFEEAMGQLFDLVERRTPVSRNKNPNVSILVAAKKKKKQKSNQQ